MALTPLLVDTNVLLRIAHFDHPQNDELLLTAIANKRHQHTLCVTIQNVAEFWNVATRPQKNNGLGRTLTEVARETDRIAERFIVLRETDETFARWRQLVERYEVVGALVHDVRLVAIMSEYRITQIYTLNPRDFARFPFITCLDPRDEI